MRFLLGRASDRPWGPSHRRLNHGSSKEETRKLARHRDKGCKCRKTFGAPCVERAGLFSLVAALHEAAVLEVAAGESK